MAIAFRSFCTALTVTALLALAGCGAPATAAAPTTARVDSLQVRSLTAGGPFMFIGGGKDQDDLMQRFVGLAGGAKAPIVIFPLASNDPAKSGQAYVDYLKTLGYANVRFTTAQGQPSTADIAMIAQARGFFFSGGDQTRILSTLKGGWRDAVTTAWKNGAAIAGTSAGSMVWGASAILEGDPQQTGWHGEDPAFGGIRLGTGLGFAPGLVVDTHFSERGRVPRLAYAVAKQRGSFGIGVDPMTAAIVFPDGKVEVRGQGTVTLIQVPPQTLKTPLSLRGVKIDVLSAGDVSAVPAAAAEAPVRAN